MKIRYIFSIALGAVLVLMSSCQKPLEMAPDGRIDIDSVFRNPDMVGAYLNTCYSNIQPKNYEYYFTTNVITANSDEAHDADAEAEPSLTVNLQLTGNITAGSGPMAHADITSGGGGNIQLLWNAYWTQIRRCNIFLTRIADAAVNDEADRVKWTAEVHVLRAYFYMELMKFYGGKLPLLDEVLPYDANFGELGIERSTSWGLAQFIIADCDEALKASDLDLPWRRVSGTERMRMTKAVAWAIKSRTSLYAASPLFNEGENHYWENAYQINKEAYEALRDNGYALYQRAWGEINSEYTNDQAYLTPVGYPADKATAAAYISEYFVNEYQYDPSAIDRETIWQHTSGSVTIWNIQSIGAQGGYKTGLNPTQEMVDAYETINGESILDRDTPYADAQHLQPNYNLDNPLYDRDNPYMNRDPRFYSSVYYHLSKRYTYWSFLRQELGEGNVRIEVVDLSADKPGNLLGSDISATSSTPRTRSRTGYYNRKFVSPTTGNSTVPNRGSAAWKHFRFGEIILNYAEAAAEANHLDEARYAVNLIRRRAAMPDIEETDQAALITRIHAERRVELAFEEHRYFDIRRWSNPGDNLGQYHRYLTAMQITSDGAGGYIYERVPTIKCRDGASYNNWQSRFLLSPIPLDEVSRIQTAMGENWQNPGW